ncbi:MAG: plasmid partition protein ParG [Candidatus Nanoarchaeia archaeon]|nr:plasmid partition protein ParG [Candidatus Nanoarchaeia archaeon]MDD5587876.1 plasmid partition protein ParG [Candidatus Nanoarchaeia archaeon]
MLQDKEFVDLAKKIIKEKPEVFEALMDFEKTGRVPKFTKKERIDITIDSEILRKFRAYCEKNSLKISNVIEKLIKNNLNN